MAEGKALARKVASYFASNYGDRITNTFYYHNNERYDLESHEIDDRALLAMGFSDEVAREARGALNRALDILVAKNGYVKYLDREGRTKYGEIIEPKFWGKINPEGKFDNRSLKLATCSYPRDSRWYTRESQKQAADEGNVKRLQAVVMGNSKKIKAIDTNTFRDCKSLASVKLVNVTEIGHHAFEGCESLASVELGAVKDIRPHAFYNCSHLRFIIIPDSVIWIGSYAFNSCRNLEHVVISDNVLNLHIGTFNNCLSLTSVKLGANVKSIQNGAFENCYSLLSVDIPVSVEIIRENAFNGCRSITKVTGGDFVHTICKSAFGRCTSLSSVEIGVNVPLLEVDEGAFQGCSSLHTLVIPSSVHFTKQYWNGITRVGERQHLQTFRDCPLTTLIVVPPINRVEFYDESTDTYIKQSSRVALEFSAAFPGIVWFHAAPEVMDQLKKDKTDLPLALPRSTNDNHASVLLHYRFPDPESATHLGRILPNRIRQTRAMVLSMHHRDNNSFVALPDEIVFLIMSMVRSDEAVRFQATP